MALFNKLAAPDSSQTQLAYKLKYWPLSMLGSKARDCIIPGKHTRPHGVAWTKQMILDKIIDQEDKRFLLHDGIKYEINWLFNCIPTEEEWDKKSDSYILKVEFRFLRYQGELPKIILSFGSWKEQQARQRDNEALIFGDN